MSKVNASFDTSDPMLVRVVLDNGTTTVKKTVRVEDYLKSFVKKSERNEEVMTYTQIPAVPKHCVHLWWHDEKNFKVLLELPAGVRATPFGTKDNLFILPYPQMLMKLDVAGGKLSGSQIFCTQTLFAETGKDTLLYSFPYGNVSTGSGNICWGNISQARNISSFADIERNVGIFFSATMNADLYQPDRSSKAGVSIEALIGMLKDTPNFPEELMYPLNMTAGKMFGID